MAHELSVNQSGQVEAAFAHRKAWHGLGTVVPALMSPKDALQQAHLDWLVEKQGLYLGNLNLIPDRVAVVRKDNGKYLGVVGKDFQPIQNHEQASFIEALCGEGGVIECVGALREGRRTFWTVKVPGNLIVKSGDEIERYLIVANGNDGSLAFRAFWSPVRVVCANTLNAAIRGMKDGITLRHTSNIKSRISEAKTVLGISNEYYQSLCEKFRKLASASLDDSGFRQYLESLVPISTPELSPAIRRFQELATQNWRQGAGSDLAGKTFWNAYNSVTEFVSHQRPARGKSVLKNTERRFESIHFGAGRTLQQRAFQMALDMAGAN